MIKQLVEDRHGIPVTIQDEMTAVNNFNALTAANHSCDLMYTWDGTLLTTIMGLDTTDIPEGQTLYDFVNEKMNEEYDLQLLGKIGVNNTTSSVSLRRWWIPTTRRPSATWCPSPESCASALSRTSSPTRAT